MTREIFELSPHPAAADVPTFLQLCADIGYPEAAHAVNTWNTDGQPGWFDDPKYRPAAGGDSRG
jgi:hypothetical protein